MVQKEGMLSLPPGGADKVNPAERKRVVGTLNDS
jgi:hypothetical protein